jgi:Arc/MetJ-type ribon-helix-helix transcriptional regulator
VGKPLMIQDDDDRRIQSLQERLGIRRKVDVVRAGMALLEQEADRQARVARWRRAAALAAPTSKVVNADFLAASRLKRRAR